MNNRIDWPDKTREAYDSAVDKLNHVPNTSGSLSIKSADEARAVFGDLTWIQHVFECDGAEMMIMHFNERLRETRYTARAKEGQHWHIRAYFSPKDEAEVR